MASRTRARINNLNDRASEVGLSERLELADIDALKRFYDFTCLKCGNKPAISPDHVVPLAKAGANTVENLQLLCENCNKSKGNEEIDYRQGKVLTTELVASLQQMPPESNEKIDKRIKHDWETIEREYVESDIPISTTELATKYAVPYPTIRDYAIRHEWVDRRREMRREVVESAHQDAVEILKKPHVKHELSARTTLFQVIEDAVSAWQSNPKPTTRDLSELLKLGLVAQGGITDRTAHVESEPDEADIYARIYKAFDTGQEKRSYVPLGPDGEEASAEWVDPF